MKDSDKQLRNNRSHFIIQTFHETLDILGEHSKKLLLHSLENDYRINLSEEGCSPPEQIESALTSMFGPGAEIIINEWKKKLSQS